MSLASTIRAAAPHTPQSVAQAFNSRSNSIGFLRWLMAFMVIFSHAGPIAGFYGGEDLGVQISKEQSIGGVAVAGFFFFSGFHEPAGTPSSKETSRRPDSDSLNWPAAFFSLTWSPPRCVRPPLRPP